MEKCNKPFTFLTSGLLIGFLFIAISLTSYGQTNPTAGTFRFESKTDKVLFLRDDVIESLYPQIEELRSNKKDVIWEYNDELRIIIFSRATIESEYFVPLSSPYEYMKQL